MLVSTVHTLSTAIDARDDVTPRHVRRVQHGTLALARELGVTDEDTLSGLEAAALLHDTGKIAVPEHILNKPGRLTASEFETMKRHAPIGAQILASIEFPYPVAPVVRHHHENWDGTGYPDGLKGEEIPLGARILSVVDCFDALTSDRPYRSRMTEQEALTIIVDRRGTQVRPGRGGRVRRVLPAHHAAAGRRGAPGAAARARARAARARRGARGRQRRRRRRGARAGEPVARAGRRRAVVRCRGAALDAAPADCAERRAWRSSCRTRRRITW